jgi:hypothetical protein
MALRCVDRCCVVQFRVSTAIVRRGYAENELPQPQPPVAFGFLNVNPEPCMDDA